MRENNVVSAEVRQEVRRVLGGPLEPPLDSASILASVDDHIYIWNSRWELSGSLAETTESAGMLRYFAQICLQILTLFPQIYDVQRS